MIIVHAHLPITFSRTRNSRNISIGGPICNTYTVVQKKRGNFVCLGFNGTFSTNRLYRAITVG